MRTTETHVVEGAIVGLADNFAEPEPQWLQGVCTVFVTLSHDIVTRAGMHVTCIALIYLPLFGCAELLLTTCTDMGVRCPGTGIVALDCTNDALGSQADNLIRHVPNWPIF